jgi:hypothetical protein
VSIHAHGRLYAPAPDSPTVAFFTHLVELGGAELAALEYRHAEHWFAAAIQHVPGHLVDPQALEVSTRFVREADTADQRLRALKLCAACAVLKGAMPP